MTKYRVDRIDHIITVSTESCVTSGYAWPWY